MWAHGQGRDAQGGRWTPPCFHSTDSMRLTVHNGALHCGKVDVCFVVQAADANGHGPTWPDRVLIGIEDALCKGGRGRRGLVCSLNACAHTQGMCTAGQEEPTGRPFIAC